MEIITAVRKFGHIAQRLLAPIAVSVTLAMCAPSHAAEKIGIVFMHGEAGAPGRVVVGLTDALEKAGFLVSRPDMFWSARRSYEARFIECLSTVDDSIVRLKNLGVTDIVVGGFGLGGNAAIAYGAGPPGCLESSPSRRVTTPEKSWRVRISPTASPERAISSRRPRATRKAISPTSTSARMGLSSAEIATTPANYLRFFGPDSEARIADNVGKVSAPLLWVAASDQSGEDWGQSDAFARAPANPYNRFVTVAGRLGRSRGGEGRRFGLAQDPQR